jgi:hypothetical protein
MSRIRTALGTKARRALGLAVAAVALSTTLSATSAQAAVPIDCATSHASLYQPTGGTFAGHADAMCNQWYFLRVMVKENGVVIRDNQQSSWHGAWTSSGVNSSPYFYCVHGRGYQTVAIVYFWNGTAAYQAGYWTTGAPRALC